MASQDGLDGTDQNKRNGLPTPTCLNLDLTRDMHKQTISPAVTSRTTKSFPSFGCFAGRSLGVSWSANRSVATTGVALVDLKVMEKGDCPKTMQLGLHQWDQNQSQKSRHSIALGSRL